MPYYNCPSCRLSINSVAAYALDRDCPRCKSERGDDVAMSVSALPHRHHMLIDGYRTPEPTVGAAKGSR